MKCATFHALLHDCRLDGETGYAATCAEIPNAVGEGETVEECLADLLQENPCCEGGIRS